MSYCIEITLICPVRAPGFCEVINIKFKNIKNNFSYNLRCLMKVSQFIPARYCLPNTVHPQVVLKTFAILYSVLQSWIPKLFKDLK